MKAKEYLMLERCVDDGIQSGLNRAYEVSDTPSLVLMREKILNEVMLEICEWFNFDGVNSNE